MPGRVHRQRSDQQAFRQAPADAVDQARCTPVASDAHTRAGRHPEIPVRTLVSRPGKRQCIKSRPTRSGITAPHIVMLSSMEDATAGGTGRRVQQWCASAVMRSPRGPEDIAREDWRADPGERDPGRLLLPAVDHANAVRRHIPMPIAWRGTLAQYAGRLHRLHASKRDVIIYDYVALEDETVQNRGVITPLAGMAGGLSVRPDRDPCRRSRSPPKSGP